MDTKENPYYQKLMKMEPLGFIDPLCDLGTFDGHLLSFREPVELLKNPYSGEVYSEVWQKKIKEMRQVYIDYYLSLIEELDGVTERRGYLTDPNVKAELIQRIRLYLELGFRISEVARLLNLVEKTIRNNWTRSEHVISHTRIFYFKKDKCFYHKLSEVCYRDEEWCLIR